MPRIPRAVEHLRRPPASAASDQLLRYVLVAGCGYLLAVVIYATEIGVGVAPYPAIVVAFVLNGLFNFVIVRLWAFPASGRTAGSDLTRFCLVALGSLCINYASFAVLYSVLELPATLSQALAIAFAAPFGFVANRLWSFGARGPRDVLG